MKKRRYCLLQAISPFLTMFSTAIYCWCQNVVLCGNGLIPVNEIEPNIMLRTEIYLFIGNNLIMAEELRYPNPEDWIFNRVISDISIVQRETTLTISDSVEIVSPVESKIVRVVSNPK